MKNIKQDVIVLGVASNLYAIRFNTTGRYSIVDDEELEHYNVLNSTNNAVCI